MKLDVLPTVISKNLQAKMIGNYDSIKPRLYTEKVAGSTNACIGFVLDQDMQQYGAVDKVTFILVLTNKKDAHRRHPACFIIRFRFNAVADKRQWSSAASKPRRKTRAKLCSRFCAENEPSHQTCRSFSASR